MQYDSGSALRRIDGDKLERVEVTGRIHVGAWVVQDEIAGANVGQKAGESGDRLGADEEAAHHQNAPWRRREAPDSSACLPSRRVTAGRPGRR